MSDPLEEQMRRNAEIYDQFVAENEAMDRAFRTGTLRSFLAEKRDARGPTEPDDELEG